MLKIPMRLSAHSSPAAATKPKDIVSCLIASNPFECRAERGASLTYCAPRERLQIQLDQEDERVLQIQLDQDPEQQQ